MREGADGCVVQREGNVGDAECTQHQQLACRRMANLVLDRLETGALLPQPAPQRARVQAKPQGLRDQIDSEINKWARVIKAAKITVD